METPSHGDSNDTSSAADDDHDHAEEHNGESLEEEDASNAVASDTEMPVAQAYRSSYNETIAPPGGPLSRVIRPPIDFPPESKRAQTIEDAEVDLEEDMEELKAAVHAYNVDFQARIDAVKLRGRVLEERIAQERQDMELSVQQLQADFRKHFQSAFLGMEQKTLSHFARLEAQQVAGEEKKIRECDADFKKFAYTTVPEIMEKLQGSITRKLEKNHETFDIENAKIQKREKKTLGALESNERKTAGSFRVERERRVAKFQEREEDWHHAMRVDNRDAERKQSSQVETLVSLRHQLHEEGRVREKEDLAILDKLAASFHQLQSSILESLGEEEQ